MIGGNAKVRWIKGNLRALKTVFVYVDSENWILNWNSAQRYNDRH